MTTRYYVETSYAGGFSALLKMEVHLFNWARERWDRCVLSEAACKRAVEEIRQEQERIHKENGRLRTVEIDYHPGDPRLAYSSGRIKIGQTGLILRIIDDWFEE